MESADVDLGMSFVNDQFFELTGHTQAPVSTDDWFNLISNEDVERVKKDWEGILKCGKSSGVQFRLKKTWVNQDGIRSNIWVQSSSYPELDGNGKVISTMTFRCILIHTSSDHCRHNGDVVRHITVQVGRECPTAPRR